MNERLVIGILTLGCKVNQYESNGLSKMLKDNNFNVVHKIEEGTYAYILNTCAVTNESEKKSRGYIAKIKKVCPNALIYICGCASQHNPHQFLNYKGVKAVLGNFGKQNIAKLIIEDLTKSDNQIYINNTETKVYDDFELTNGERTRTVIKIQDGCNNFCSYCLIPYIRGRERSREFDSVKKEIEFNKDKTKEIIFTGINLSNYGKDLSDNLSLKDIAILMRNYPDIRFRFSSLEQNIIDEEFLQVLKDTPNFVAHFHLSLQSGTDKTLKAMNRKYTTEEYYKKIELINKYFKNATNTTDVIVGFPTETDEDFEKTCEFVKKCKFSKIHIFPYSKRSNTIAANMVNVATNVKQRVEKLTAINNSLRDRFLLSQIGENLNVIIETCKDGYLEGYSENYIKCYINSKNVKAKHNDVVKVQAKEPFKDGLLCKLCVI